LQYPGNGVGCGDRLYRLPAGSWAIGAVNAAKDYGLMQGTGEGTFGFGNSITKAEFIAVLTECSDGSW
jgi:hypothetical protein